MSCKNEYDRTYTTEKLDNTETVIRLTKNIKPYALYEIRITAENEGGSGNTLVINTTTPASGRFNTFFIVAA